MDVETLLGTELELLADNGDVDVVHGIFLGRRGVVEAELQLALGLECAAEPHAFGRDACHQRTASQRQQSI